MNTKKRVVNRRKNYRKGKNAEDMATSLEEAKLRESPNIKEIAEKFNVSRKALSNWPEQTRFQRSLFSILSNSQAKIVSSIKKTLAQRKNMIGEFFDDAKILNSKERIEALSQEIKKKTDAKDAKLIKVKLQPKKKFEFESRKRNFTQQRKAGRFQPGTVTRDEKLESIKQI